MAWIECNTTIVSDDEIMVVSETSNLFVLEIPKIKKTWDFAGWCFLKIFSDIGLISTYWKRVYFGEKQKIEFASELNFPYELIFRKAAWLPAFTTYSFGFQCWRWEPIYKIKYLEIEVDIALVEVLPLNFNRKDYSIFNLGVNSLELYWGENASFTFELQPKFQLEENNTQNKRSLSAKATKEMTTIQVAERSEL
ncbi:hypothetical protein [Coleofasciculus sp. E2-BRE-01]|uniref:hypothetical protein n=1 Tax=Coleofasciculus sp. E2-BRE-01 TaxID=3069524 RepID=UPI0032F9EC60